MPKTDLVEKILSDYIGKRVMALEIEKLGIMVNDNSLRNIIKSDELFSKENKFSKTEYEKFLIKSGATAAQFESNIVEQETRRQFISSLSGGVEIPETLVHKEFKKENQSKTIKYIDLEQFHSKNKPSNKSKKELYEKNKDIFFTEFKTIRYVEIDPEIVSGSKEYNENFFKKLDDLENNILDGQSLEDTAFNNNLEIITIKKINAKKEDENKKKIKNIPDNLFEKMYNLNSSQSPAVLNTGKKYYLAEISNIEKKERPFDDIEVQEALNAQLNFKNKIENNNALIKDINMGAFSKERYFKFALENKLKVIDYKINDLRQNEIFTENIIKKIYLIEDGKINLITDNALTKTYLVFSVKTDYKTLKKNSNEYEQYEAKARLNLINKIYQSHDNNLNEKYKVELNQRTIDRVKNSF